MNFIYKDVIYPHKKNENEIVSEERILASEKKIVDIVNKYNVELIAIGNGTASRETEKLVLEAISQIDKKVQYAIVSEAGASVRCNGSISCFA